MKLKNIIKIFIIIMTIAIYSCGEDSLEKGKYRINGVVSGLDKGEIYLMNYPNPSDTIKVENGRFTIEKELKDIVGLVAILKNANIEYMNAEISTIFFIEPSIMTLELDYNDFSNSRLTGSKTQDDQYKLDDIRKKIADKYKKENATVDSIWEKYEDAKKSNASEKELEAIKYEIGNEKDKLEPMLEEQSKATLQFIKDNPKSFVSVQSLQFLLFDMKYDEAKAISDKFNPEHLKTDLGIELIKDIENMRKGIPGALAGNFDTTDINGNSIKLADFKGQYLLIDFWASWCVPCRKGNPHLISLYEKYHLKGLDVLGVANDDHNHKAWREAVAKDKIGVWHHVLRGYETKKETSKQINVEKDISKKYNISSLPTKILVDPKGVIIGRYGSGGGTDADMDRDLAELFD